MSDRLDRLERHLDHVLAGPRRLMRSLGKHTTGSDAMTNASESASPQIKTEWPNSNFHNTHSTGGLTKREHFAAMAMQGLVSDLDRSEGLAEVLEAMQGLEIGSMENARALRAVIAKMAVGHADALIAELNKETL